MTDLLTLLEKSCREARELGALSKQSRERSKTAPRLLLAGAPVPQANGDAKAAVHDPAAAMRAEATQLSGMWAQTLLNLRVLAAAAVQSVGPLLTEHKAELEALGIVFQEGP